MEDAKEKVQEKIKQLGKSNFSQEDCFNFFGGLNQEEIKFLLTKIRKQELKIPIPEIEIFLIDYLEKLNQKITEKIDNKKNDS